MLAPKSYILDGECEWRGEDDSDRGMIVVKKNRVFVRYGEAKYGNLVEA